MFQDIEPYSFSNDFAWVDPEPADRVLIYRGNKVVVRNQDSTDEPLHFPSYEVLLEKGVVGPQVVAEKEDCAIPVRTDGVKPRGLLLFTVGETAYFRCEIKESALDALLETEEWVLLPVGQLRNYAPKYRAFAGMVGYEWYDTRHYCGRCGTKMQHGIVERMLQCPKCGCMEFSRLFPAVIVGIVDRQRDRVLVSRYAGREYTSYALIAGFSEMGETVEQTVHREVMEEVGLKVTNLRYYKSQPWPPSSSLLFGFFCDLDGESSITLDDHELEEAEWISRDELPDDEDYSLTREMMGVLRRGEETHYPVAFYG
mgnify:FL=1